MQRALAIQEEVLGPRHPDLVLPLSGLARIAHAEHDDGTARRLAERAVSIVEAADVSQRILADVRFLLAQVSWSDPSQRARARTLAKQARDACAALGEPGEDELPEIDAWLAEHPVP